MKARWPWWLGWVLTILVLCGPAGQAQSRLLHVRDAAVLPDGRGEFTIGLGYTRNERFPFFTAPGALRSQHRAQLPHLGFRAGAANWAEIELGYEALYLNEETIRGETNWQYGSGDARIHTKLRVRAEDDRWPAVAVRFGTKLPNANKDKRLGTDETDFDVLGMVSRRVGPLRLHVNLGLALLGNPGQLLGTAFAAGGQDDLFVYAVALESPTWGAGEHGASQVQLLAEVQGLAGSRFGNDRSRGTFGLRLTQGDTGVFFGATVGFTTGDEDIGCFAGVTHAWDLGRWVEKIQ